MSELGTLLPSIRVEPPGPASLELARRLRRVETRNVTYLSDDLPPFWEEARGGNVRDADGNVYLDLSGAFGVTLAGHAHPAVTEAVARQCEILVHGMGDVHPPVGKVELLEALARIAPWPEARATLASAGSEAVEIALKTARVATGRPGIIAFHGGYHGLTLGSLAVTWRDHFRADFRERLYPGVGFAPFPCGGGVREADGGDASAPSVDEALEAVASLLASGAPNGDPVGCILVEPIQGRAGVRIPPPGFLTGLGKLARDAGALLIFDEIFTGLGRTGALFGFQHESVTPDVVCLGKTMAGGLPLSACLGRSAVMDAWPESDGEAIHTSTFLGNPLACAASLAYLYVLEAEDLVGRAESLGRNILGALKSGLHEVPWVWEVRGRGLLLGIELCLPEAGEPWKGGGAAVATAALKRGLIVLPAGEEGEVVELAPPAILTEEQVRWAVAVLVEVLEEVGPE